MTNRIPILVVLWMVAATGCKPKPAQRPDVTTNAAELKVEVTPVETTYSVKRHGGSSDSKTDPNSFLVRFHVTNLSSTRYSLGIMSCSYFDHWQTDNEDVSVARWGCDSNYPVPHLLTGGNPYTAVLPLRVSSAAGREVTFRMGFTPEKEYRLRATVKDAVAVGGTYWSDPIKISVVE